MISLPIRFSHINRVVLIVGIVCLAALMAGVIFVGAQSNSDKGTAAFAGESSTKTRVAQGFGKLPLSFEINNGQTDPRVKFLSHGPGYDLYLTATETVLSLRKPQARQTDKIKRPGSTDTTLEPQTSEGSVLRLKMIGANKAPRVEGVDELPGKANYFIGNDREKWRRNISTYRKVRYSDVYPGIDIVYYGNQRELEYDFVVAAGVDPKLIKFTVEGAERLRLDQKGNLLLTLKHGEVRLNKPFVYQLTDEGNRSEVKGSYAINGNEIRFKVRGADSGKPLVIDPVLSYSTFLGGTSIDQAFGIAVDSQGSAYVTGATSGFQFPITPGAFKGGGLLGAFVTKLDPTGSTLIYSTYINGIPPGVAATGPFFTFASAIAVDSSGNAHVTGVTTAPDFPVVNPLKTNGIFFKTTDAGSTWSNNNNAPQEGLSSLAVAPSNPNVLYAGSSSGPYRSTDAGATWTKTSTVNLPEFPFISALAVDPTNSSIVYAGSHGVFKTTNGGNNWTVSPTNNGSIFRAIVFDPLTPSTIYAGSSSGLFRSTDSGNTWTGISTIGNPTDRDILSIAIDPTTPSTIYVGTLGHGLFKTTNSGASWTPINNGITTGFGANPAVVDDITIDPFNSSTLYINVAGTINKSTNGGSSWAPLNNTAAFGLINAMVADRSNPSNLYVGTVGNGVIKTSDGGNSWTPVNNGLWSGIIRVLAADPSNSATLYAGGSDVALATDAFVTKLNSSGSDLLFSTYLGGNNNESGNGIAVDGSGNIYVAGNTSSKNFPTQNPFQAAPHPADLLGNAFVTKLNPAAPSYVFSTYLGGSSRDEASSIAIDSATNVYVTGNTISNDFPTVVNAFQTQIGDTQNGDAFVTKLNSSGSSLSYSTYLGGSSSDSGAGIAVDTSGNAYITGITNSTNFPTANPIQAASNLNFDAFVTKLNSQGSALVYSTYLGGKNFDSARGIAVDATGNAYVTGFSDSQDFPTVAGALRTRSEMFKSVDGGAHWSNDNYGLRDTAIFHLAVHPTQSSTLYAGTTDGVFRSTNGGRTWSAINNGLGTPRIHALVIDPLTPSTIYVATEFSGDGTNGIYKSVDGGDSWNLHNDGLFDTHVRGLAIDPVTPATLYVATFGGQIYKTTNAAVNWAPTGAGGPGFPWAVAVDPHNHTTVYATDFQGANGVFRSTNAGASWQHVGLNDTGSGLFIKVSPHTPNLVFATMSIGGVFKSVDGGNNWSPVRPETGEIVFDPVDPSTLYLVSSLQGLLKSTNGGQTWTSINKGLPLFTVFALAVDPLRPSNLYVSIGSTNDDDAFVTKISPSGNALVYSTLIGGLPGPEDFFNINDQAYAIAVDQAGNAYITGLSFSDDFPVTPNSYQPFNAGFADAFITKLTMSFIISGHVLDGGSAPVSGAEVVLNDGASVTSVFTGTDGSYEFSHLREGGSFTVSAAKPHFTMAPPSQSFNNLSSNQTLDFVATPTNAPFFTISGQVTDNGVGLPGVTVTLSGSQSGVRLTDNNGNYSFEVPGGGNYTVTPSVTGFTFGPLSQTFNNLSASQTANFPGTRHSLIVTNTNNAGAGSLREAITLANATFGTDTITFNIPGPGIKVIHLSAALPEIADPVVIDGATQPGFAGAPLIELAGDNLGVGNGLIITGGNTTVRGLAIGGFNTAGIDLRACNNNVIQGNYIGIDATGSQQRANSTGIRLSFSSNNLIGGTTAAARNVISGNIANGLAISGSNNLIQGNFIGTNPAGTAPLGLGFLGINIEAIASTNNLIGGTAAGAGNVISGHTTGIHIESSGNTVQGNLIGTDVTGTNKITNSLGVEALVPNILIGGLTPEARNVISGNSVGVSVGGQGTKLQGNFIGTDITGTVALGNSFGGVRAINGALIGGTVPGARNVIAGNEQSNISLEPHNSGQIVTVQGNYIGTDVTGSRALSAVGSGIAIFSSNNLIGGLVPEAQNKIAFNGQDGVMVSFSSSGNSIRGNSIFSNDGLGIDLENDGVTANDPGDVDGGANTLQNFPVLTSVMSVGNSTTIQGSLNSTPNKTFQIDFYSSAALDPSGNGEGALFLGTTAVTTNGNGAATINANFPVALGAGRVVTATATDPNGNTSEFSAGDPANAGGNLQFSVGSIQVIEDVGLATITVLRKGGSAGSLTIDYATANGTATAGQDYTSTSGTLTFNGGETSKSFQVPILDDAVTEPDETFNVVLSNASNPEVVGAPSTLVVTIQDRTTVPVISQGSALVAEGDTGSTTDALITFTLSAATGRSVSVNYATSNLAATGGAACGSQGVDYETKSGTIVFEPGNTAVTIAVKICGDRSAEASEGFLVNLSSPANATLDDSQALVAIADDDVLELLLEEAGPTVGQAAALDAFFLVRDPFRVVLPDWFPTPGADRNTRVMLFVRGLELNPGEPTSAVVVRLTNGIQIFDVPAQDVRSVPDVDFTQVIIRVPDGISAGPYAVTITAHSRTSNVGTIRVTP